MASDLPTRTSDGGGPARSEVPLAAAAAAPRLSEVLPPIILGTATFNTQYVFDPASMPAYVIVARAFELGIRAFDTSPYYGPAETLLGEAIARAAGYTTVQSSASASAPASTPPGGQETKQQEPSLTPRHPRSSYLLISKAGRVGPSQFDYSPAAVTASVRRSLTRLRTPYLDLVYLHDVEFVSDAEVLAALAALRELQAQGLVRFVGISGYPVPRLLSLAEKAAAATAGQQRPLDAVLSYGHCTVQNTLLARDETLARFRAAGVDVVLNASILGMGLLTFSIDAGPQERWHPAPEPLRRACIALRAHCEGKAGRRLEGISIRYALEEWARTGAAAGLGVGSGGGGTDKVGATVIGVTTVAELEETMEVWHGVVRDLGLNLPDPATGTSEAAIERHTAESSGNKSHDGNGVAAVVRKNGGAQLAQSAVVPFVHGVLWPVLGEWKDHSWASPPVGWWGERGGKRDP